MKKLILSMFCALAMTGVAFGQGTVAWNAITPTFMSAQTNADVYSPLFGGGDSPGAVGATATTGAGFYYELLYMPSTSTFGTALTMGNFALWSDAGLGATNSSSAGRLTPLANQNSLGATVPWAPGVTDNIVLVGWSANIGTSWLSVSNTLANWATLGGSIVGNAFFGVSATGYITPSASATGNPVFANGPQVDGLPIFSPNTQLYLLPVPEPTTVALAGLGGLALLAFRRRK